MQLIVNSLLTNYERRGQGKVVLLLHGWGDNLSTFKDLQATLSQRYDVISVDLPGFGKSETPKTSWGLNDYAQFLNAFLAKLQVSASAVIGHSNGGAIAIRAIAKQDLSPDKLVLLASAGIRDQYKGRKKALRLMAKTGKVLMSPLPQKLKYRLRRKAYQTIGSDMFVAEHMQETFKKIITDDVQADAAKVQTPTLLIYGDQDEQTPLRYGEQFQKKLGDAKLSVVAGAGHFLLHDKPAEVQNLITGFLV